MLLALDVFRCCAVPQDEFDALILHEAFAGIGCNKKVVVEVLTTRPFARLQAARAYYERRYDTGLLDRLR